MSKAIYEINDYGIKTIQYKHYIRIQHQDLLKHSFRTRFVSYADNLGSIALQFDTYHRINKDSVLFRIREKNESKWFYQNTYKTDQIQPHSYFPFGFPVQKNSRNKTYEIEVSSYSSDKNNHIAIDGADHIQAVYSISSIYNARYIIQKLASYIHNEDLLWKSLSIALIACYFLLFFIYQKVLLIFGKLTEIYLRHFKRLLDVKSILHSNIWVELSFILFFIILFFDSALVNDRFEKPLASSFIAILISIHVFFVFSSILSLFHIKIQSIVDATRSHILLITGLFVVVLIRLPFINDLPRWDGGMYFNALSFCARYFNMNMHQYLDIFKWWAHPSYGYSTYMSILQFFGPYNPILMHISNIALMILTTIFFYKMLLNMFQSKSSALIASLLFVCNPLFFALSFSPNLDFAVTCFLVLAISCFFEKRFILFAFFGILTVFSKEIGIIFLYIWIGLYLVTKITLMVTNQKIFTLKVFGLVLWKSTPYVISTAIPALFFFLYLLYTRGSVWGGTISTTASNFGVPSLFFIKTRMGEYFILNAIYLIWFFVFIRFAKLTKERKLYPFFGTLLSIMIFNLLYITYPHPRYILLCIPFVLVLFAKAIQTYRFKSQLLMGGLLILISVTQIYSTIDPISRLYFGTFSWGDKRLLEIGDKYSSRCDSLIYNSQYVMMDRLFDVFLKKEHITKTETLIINELEGYTNPQFPYWLANFSQSMQFVTLYVDPKNNKRTYQKDNMISVQTANISDIMRQPVPAAYFIYLPWLDSKNRSTQIDALRNYYAIGKESNITENGFVIYYYKIHTMTP